MNQDPIGIFAVEAFVINYWQIIMIIILLPLLIQIIVNAIISIIKTFTGIDITVIIRLFAFPGTLFRMTLIYFTLSWLGWRVKISEAMSVGAIPSSIGHRSYFRGFIISMTPTNDRQLTVRDTIFISLVSYLGFIFSWFWWNLKEIMIPYLQALFSYNKGPWIYYYIFFSFLIGGLPVPEETLLPIYYFIAKNPHIILGIMGHFIASAILSGMFGSQLALLYLFISVFFTVAMVSVEREELESLEYGTILDYKLALLSEDDESNPFRDNPVVPLV